MACIGIDFGNMQSCIAVARNRGIDIICNEASNRFSPSLVSFGQKSRSIGESAATLQMSNMKNTVGSLKRLLGRTLNDPEVQLEKKFLSCELVNSGIQNEVGVEIHFLDEKKVFSATQLCGMYLGKLKGIAEYELGAPVTEAVISVPGWFTPAQRQAMTEACDIAGLGYLRLMNENVAAALAYGITKHDLPEETPRNVIFVDMGHSSTSISAVSYLKGKLAVKATLYDNHMGGRDLDELLVAHFVEEFKTKYKFDLSQLPKPLLRLRSAIEKLKKVLSTNSQSPLNIEALHDDRDVSSMITRSDFEKYAEPFLGRIGPLLEQLLSKAGWTKDQVDIVEMVGGSSRVPSVRDTIKDFFGRELFTFTTNPDEAVSRGCALLCAILSPAFKVRDFEVKDIASHAFKLSWTQEAQKQLIAFDATSAVPSTKLLSFYMRQPSLDLDVLLEPTQAFVGRYTVKNIPVVDQANAAVPVKVKVRLNPNQMFQIESAYALMDEDPMDVDAPAATDAPASNETTAEQFPADESNTEVTPKKKVSKKMDLAVVHGELGLPKDVVQKLREEEISMINHDRLVFDTEFAKNALEEYIYDARSKKDTDWSDFLETANNAKLTDLINAAEDWLYTDEGENATKSVFTDKLKEMKAFGQPAEEKVAEFQMRPHAEKQFMAVAQQIMEKANEPEHAWLGDDLEALKTKCTEKAEWLQSMLQQQDELAKHMPLVIKVAQIDKERDALQRQATVLFAKPKPKPPTPVPAETADDAAAEKPAECKEPIPGAAPAAGSPTPMDTDSEEYVKIDA